MFGGFSLWSTDFSREVSNPIIYSDSTLKCGFLFWLIELLRLGTRPLLQNIQIKWKEFVSQVWYVKKIILNIVSQLLDNFSVYFGNFQPKIVRPFVVGAVLRGLKLTPESYASFIDLQDKLHQNICRKRTLVSIGTHDLDTVDGPFTYDAKPPQNIHFIPLNQTMEYTGLGIMDLHSVRLLIKIEMHMLIVFFYNNLFIINNDLF